ncbi:hypothetical protein BDA99DRAFT_585237, partial [Phascolomyces articulosus]
GELDQGAQILLYFLLLILFSFFLFFSLYSSCLLFFLVLYMSLRPENEPDENEPDENEPDEDEGGHHTATTASSPTGSSGKHHATPASAGTANDSNNTLPAAPSSDNSVPTSTIGPLTVALVVILVIITCFILHCARVRKRMNDEQRTQTINGWTSFLSQFKSQKSNIHKGEVTTINDMEQGITVPPPAAAAATATTTRGMTEKDSTNSGGTWRKPVKKRDYYDRAFHYRMSKPSPLPPCDPTEEQQEQYNNSPAQRGTSRKSKERQPSIVFSPGWIFAFSDKENETESKNSQKHLIDKGGGSGVVVANHDASTPLSPPESAHTSTTLSNTTITTIPTTSSKKNNDPNPERLCPHQVTVDRDLPSPSILLPLHKPHEKSPASNE